MAKLTLLDVLSTYGSTAKLSHNNTAIETAIEDTLSRSGTSPNEMNAVLDMNSYAIINLPTPTTGAEAATKSYVDTVLNAALLTGIPPGWGTGGFWTFISDPTSANFADIVSDETGTGSLVFSTSPTLTTPTLGVASVTSLNGYGISETKTPATLAARDTEGNIFVNDLHAERDDGTGAVYLGTGLDHYLYYDGIQYSLPDAELLVNNSPVLKDSDLGATVQGYSGNLTIWSAVTPTATGVSLVTAANYAAVKALLDLEAGTDFYSISAANAAFQPLDADLTTWAAVTPSANGISLVSAANYAAMRALLDLEAGTDFYSISAANAAFQAKDADLTTWASITPSANAVSLVSAANYAAMRTLLDLEAGTDFYSISAANAAFQPLDADLTTWAAISPSANAISLVSAANYAAMRTLLDLEAGTDFYSVSAANTAFQAKDADLTSWAGVTRASGFDTFTTTPSSANLRSLLTDETGTGSLVFATSPSVSRPTFTDGYITLDGSASSPTYSGIHQTARRSGSTYYNAYIRFDGPRSDTSDTGTNTGRGAITLLGQSGTTASQLFIGANTSGISPGGLDQTSARALQSQVEISSTSTEGLRYWQAGTEVFQAASGTLQWNSVDIPTISSTSSLTNKTYLGGSMSGTFTQTAPAVFNTTASGAVSGGIWQEVVMTNDHTGGAAGQRLIFNQDGDLNDGGFTIGHTVLAKAEDITSGNLAAQWLVAETPYSTAPGAQSFGVMCAELNPQNRYADHGYETNRFDASNWSGGIQMVSETQDFTGALAAGTRPGHHSLFGYLLAQSSITDSTTEETAKFYNGLLFEPNAIAAGGRGFYNHGYRPFVKSVTIGSGGTGYVVGDVVFISGGTVWVAATPATARVLAVSGGVATSVEVYYNGIYTVAPTGTVATTGGSGTGLTLAITASSSSDAPYAGIQLDGEYAGGKAIVIPDASGIYAWNATANDNRLLLTTSANYTFLGAVNNALGIQLSTENAGKTAAEIDTSVGSSITDYVSLKGTNASGAQINAKSSGSNADIVLTPKGTGVVVFDGGIKSVGATNGIETLESEISWTPTIVSSGGGESVTYTAQGGQYLLLGKYCFVHGRVHVASISGGSGVARIGGLPFTVVNSSTLTSSGSVNSCSGFVTQAPTHLGPNQNTTHLGLRYIGTGSTGSTDIPIGNVAAGSNIYFSCMYKIA